MFVMEEHLLLSAARLMIIYTSSQAFYVSGEDDWNFMRFFFVEDNVDFKKVVKFCNLNFNGFIRYKITKFERILGIYKIEVYYNANIIISHLNTNNIDINLFYIDGYFIYQHILILEHTFSANT